MGHPDDLNEWYNKRVDAVEAGRLRIVKRFEKLDDLRKKKEAEANKPKIKSKLNAGMTQASNPFKSRINTKGADGVS